MQMPDTVIRMPDNGLHVLVIGGGIGGLCLAHGLRRVGVGATVYERTRVRTDWLQGYRIHISPQGAAALHACLPPAQWDAFAATAGKPSAGFAFLTEQLRDLLFLPRCLIAGQEAGPEASHHSVSRITLRHVLLPGLDDVIHLGKEFTHYEQAPGGHVLRRRHLGHRRRAGCRRRRQLPGPPAVPARRPPRGHRHRRDRRQAAAHRSDPDLVARLSGSVNNIMPPRDSFLFTAVWEGDQQRLAINDPDMPPGLLFDNTQDYVFWAYAAKRSNYPADPTGDGAQLRDMVASMISSWPQRCNGWSASPTPPPSRKWSSGQWHPSRRGLPRASPCSATPSTT